MSVVERPETTPPIRRTDPSSRGVESFDSDSTTDVRVTPNRWRRLGVRLAWSAAALAILGAGGYGAAKYAGLFDGDAVADRQTHTVARGDLIVRVSEDGNLESSSNTEIRCLVAGGSTIKWIVPDGKIVEPNERLVELNSAPIDEQILTQTIAFERAKAIRDQARNDLAAAYIALDEYVYGTYKKEQQAAESLLTVAKQNLSTAQNALEFAERMYRKGYITELQRDAQKFALKRADLDVQTAETAKGVLEKFTYVKMTNDFLTLIATNEAKSKSEEAAFQLEKSKLDRLHEQKKNCVIVAEKAGMVVYANDNSSWFGGSDRPKIEEGAAVRESQIILYVPDLANMQVKVNVHESKVDSLRPFMGASVRIQNRKFTGYVTAVANQPEAASRYSSGVKTYATMVQIDGAQAGLKPGMTAKVDILVEERKNVLTVPVQCVVEQLGKSYCWKVAGNEVVKTEVTIKPGDDKSVEIVAGLAEGDVVLQNPPERAEGPQAGDSRREFGGKRGRRDGAPADDGKPADPSASGSLPPAQVSQAAGKPSGAPSGPSQIAEKPAPAISPVPASSASTASPESPAATALPTGGLGGNQ